MWSATAREIRVGSEMERRIWKGGWVKQSEEKRVKDDLGNRKGVYKEERR